MQTRDQWIGERVHYLMWRQKLTQAKLGAILGCSQTTVSKKVHGERPWFASELLDVAKALNTHVTALLPELDDIEPDGSPAAIPLPRLDSNQQPFDHSSVECA
jgi:transcriptional regulator with XRE-family HTH domain